MVNGFVHSSRLVNTKPHQGPGNVAYLSKVTLFASFTTRHRSGRSKSSELVSDASTAMTIRVSDTWRAGHSVGYVLQYPNETHFVDNSFGFRSFRCRCRGLRLLCTSVRSDVGFDPCEVAWPSLDQVSTQEAKPRISLPQRMWRKNWAGMVGRRPLELDQSILSSINSGLPEKDVILLLTSCLPGQYSCPQLQLQEQPVPSAPGAWVHNSTAARNSVQSLHPVLSLKGRVGGR